MRAITCVVYILYKWCCPLMIDTSKLCTASNNKINHVIKQSVPKRGFPISSSNEDVVELAEQSTRTEGTGAITPVQHVAAAVVHTWLPSFADSNCKST